jgi:hypothetical protein
MALTKEQLEALNQSSFPNNNSGNITATDLRTFNQELIDNTVNQTVYTTDSSSFDYRINEVSSSHTQVPEGTVSGSSQIDYPLISNIPSGIISSSEQLPSGVVSGSSQIILEDTTGNLSGSRIEGAVALATNSVSASIANSATTALLATSASHAEVADEVPYIGVTGKPTLVSGSSQVSDITGSSLVTASFATQTLTFTKGDGTTFSVTIPDVSGSDITSLNQFTASQEIYNSGINSYTQSTDVTIGNIETYVTSSSQRIDLIEDFTSSQELLNTTFATTGSNTFNGDQLVNGVINIKPTNTAEGAPPVINVNYPITGVLGTTGSVNFTVNQYQEEVDPGVFETFTQYKQETAGFDGTLFTTDGDTMDFEAPNGGIQFLAGGPMILRAGGDGTGPVLLGGAVENELKASFYGSNTTPEFIFDIRNGNNGLALRIANQSGSAVIGRVFESYGGWRHNGAMNINDSFGVNSPSTINLNSPAAGLNMSGDFGDGTKGLRFNGEGQNGGVIEFNIFNSDNPFAPAGTVSFGNFFEIPGLTQPLTETIKFRAQNIDFTGSIDVSETIRLTPLDPLPAGVVGELAVSGSDLYFHNGTSWIVK